MKATDVMTINGRTASAAEHAKRNGINWRCAYNRVCMYGWSPERAVTAPVQTKSQAGKTGKARSYWAGQPIYRFSRSRRNGL